MWEESLKKWRIVDSDTKKRSKNRVDCADCVNFTYTKLLITIVQGKDKERCLLGKRVMFRSKSHPDLADYEAGWPRYCDDFKLKSTTVSDDA